MHRIASLGDVQESNKNERHHPAPDKNVAAGGTRPGFDEEGKAALVDFGKVFEAVMKHTVAGTTTLIPTHPTQYNPFDSTPFPLFKQHARNFKVRRYFRLFCHSCPTTVHPTL